MGSEASPSALEGSKHQQPSTISQPLSSGIRFDSARRSLIARSSCAKPSGAFDLTRDVEARSELLVELPSSSVVARLRSRLEPRRRVDERVLFALGDEENERTPLTPLTTLLGSTGAIVRWRQALASSLIDAANQKNESQARRETLPRGRD